MILYNRLFGSLIFNGISTAIIMSKEVTYRRQSSPVLLRGTNPALHAGIEKILINQHI